MRVARRRGVAGQRVTDERQIRVEGAGPAHPAADTARLVLDRSPNRLTVEAELGRDGPDLPVLAVVQTPDLGALRGRDHRRSSSDGRGVPASRPATGSTARRPRSGWPRAPEPGRDQRRGVWPMAGGRRNPDPSRGGGRGRRAGGRGGRGALPDSADAEPGQPAPSGGGRAPGTAACSRLGCGHTSRRWQTGGCNVGRSSWRSWRSGTSTASEARGASSDWTTRSNRGTTAPTGSLCRSTGRSRGSGGHTEPSPHVSARCLRYPNEALPASSGACGRRHSCGRKQPRPHQHLQPSARLHGRDATERGERPPVDRRRRRGRRRRGARHAFVAGRRSRRRDEGLSGS